MKKKHLDKTDVEQLRSGKQVPVNPIEGIRSLLMREIAVQLLSNRLCANNIALLHELHKLDAKANNGGRFKLEFDIDVSDRTFRDNKPKPEAVEGEEADEGTSGGEGDVGTSGGIGGASGSIGGASGGLGGPPGTGGSTSGTGGSSSGGRGGSDAGTPDAGTLTTVRVETTTEGGFEVEGGIPGLIHIKIIKKLDVKETAEPR